MGVNVAKTGVNLAVPFSNQLYSSPDGPKGMGWSGEFLFTNLAGTVLALGLAVRAVHARVGRGGVPARACQQDEREPRDGEAARFILKSVLEQGALG